MCFGYLEAEQRIQLAGNCLKWGVISLIGQGVVSVICCQYVSEFEHEFAFGHASTFFSLCPHTVGGLAFNCMDVSLSKLFFLMGPGPAKVF